MNYLSIYAKQVGIKKPFAIQNTVRCISGATYKYKQVALPSITFFQTNSENQTKFQVLERIESGNCVFGNLMTEFEF